MSLEKSRIINLFGLSSYSDVHLVSRVQREEITPEVRSPWAETEGL